MVSDRIPDMPSVADGYLRGRSRASFDRDDFDCLSNKFTSKLVIRAH